ncbi:UDP-N-acetylmuramoyl-L-alanyl-D-glutamate--2,6-diaminopimelate ligase [Clostridium sp. D2Q-14]|uniref:Mur ligase family protein n=1 Tax=Anaeromonas gelatinilytica TaxID=2683194 RepID=UPI00193C2F53|nr:UDP-N-acetylmuramoyl-L-alanyl-D-glutamate--2,6-diaminopimelate ligase [Anaeromonas gelatinilytica]MBS4534499.1 UDP-N-acetylmuramoyl-L-alanyl-D-glutamate--2,6-diaminopimelate ligase [Anaeromonas gelatinilytica]
MIKLNFLLESINILESWKEKNMDISGIAYHSRKVKPGNLFVCIKGYKTDGHRYIMGAIANGADAIVVEEFQEGWDIPQYKVENSREALAALSNKFYDNPSKDMKIIGITGTNGKTTTSFMTDTILSNHGYNTGLIGTVMSRFGDSMIPSILTTPESLDLQNYFSQMKKQDISHVTMEVSSSALELNRVSNVDFDIVTFNNISREHIDLHGSFEEYFNAKASLIRNAGSNKWAILNVDSPRLKELINETKANVLTFSVEGQDGDLYCKNLDISTGRAEFTVVIQRSFKTGNTEYTPKEFKISLSVPGYHSVYNSMVAIAIALLSEIPIPTIQKSLKEFVGVERRFQFIFEDNFKIIDDHFANAGNIDVTLGTLSRMVYKDLTLVYAIRGSRGPTVNRENAEIIAKWAKKLGLTEITATLSKSHVTEKDKVTTEEISVFKEVMNNANIKVNLYEELQDAIAYGLSQAKNSDIVLLAGCQGMDYGAHIALDIIHKSRPDISKNLLYKPLRNRVAGTEDIQIIE